MKTKITITLDQARSWFRSGNEELRELALQAFVNGNVKGSCILGPDVVIGEDVDFDCSVSISEKQR